MQDSRIVAAHQIPREITHQTRRTKPHRPRQHAHKEPPHPIMARIVDQLHQRSAAQFFGRHAELLAFERSLTESPPTTSVFLIHGPGGVGKTTLSEQMKLNALRAGWRHTRLDGRNIEPSTQGVLQALSEALDLPTGHATLPQVLGAWRQQPKRLLIIDAFEHLSHLSFWLRDRLLAELPDQTLIILSGRDAPGELWQTDPCWRHGCATFKLSSLSSADCEQALKNKPLSPAQRTAITRLSHGHPLTLMLLADVTESSGDTPHALGPDVIRELTRCFATQAPSRQHREALAFCALARVTTQELLSAMLGEPSAASIFDWLASLSFMEPHAEGLVPHDLVRDAMSAEMHWRTPHQAEQIKQKLLTHHMQKARGDHPAARTRAALDIFYLNRGHPVMRHFVDFAALGSTHSEPATHQDHPDITALVHAELGPAHAALVQRWQHHPGATWWLVRSPSGTLSAAMLHLEIDRLTTADFQADPALRQLHEWMSGRAPLKPHERAICARIGVVKRNLPNPSSCVNALQVRTFSLWMSEPALAWFALTNVDPDHWRPMMQHIDFHPIDAHSVEMDGQRLGTFVHDWRTVPLSAWPARIGGKAGPDHPLAPSHLPPNALAHMAKTQQQDFKSAVHDALRHWHDATALARSPLLNKLELPDNSSLSTPERLRQLITHTALELARHPRQARFMKTIELTYWRPVGSQELAAERLGLPFGTYRYQLRTAIERLSNSLQPGENNESKTLHPHPD